MNTFEYTHTQDVDSSAVDEVYYNANTNSLAVTLHGAVYEYSDVPFTEYRDLVDANSVGRAFRQVKADYGPSEFLGYDYEMDYRRVSQTPLHVSAGRHRAGVGAPQSWSDSANVYITLPTPEAKAEFHEYAVTFVAPSGFKTTSVKESSIAEAVANIERLAEMLDLDFDVVKVERLD